MTLKVTFAVLHFSKLPYLWKCSMYYVRYRNVYSPNASFFFQMRYICRIQCVEVDKISIDIVRRAVLPR